MKNRSAIASLDELSGVDLAETVSRLLRAGRPDRTNECVFPNDEFTSAVFFFLSLLLTRRTRGSPRRSSQMLRPARVYRCKSLSRRPFRVYSEKIRAFYHGGFCFRFFPFPSLLRGRITFFDLSRFFSPGLFLLFFLFFPTPFSVSPRTATRRPGPVKRQPAFGLPESSAKKINELPILRRHPPPPSRRRRRRTINVRPRLIYRPAESLGSAAAVVNRNAAAVAPDRPRPPPFARARRAPDERRVAPGDPYRAPPRRRVPLDAAKIRSPVTYVRP